MTWIDWAIAAFVLFGALQGLRRGLLAALVGIVVVLIAYLAASAWYKPVGELVRQWAGMSPEWSATVAFAAILLLVVNVFGILVIMAAGSKSATIPSRIAGLLVGTVRGVLLATVLLVVLLASPPWPSQPIRRDVERSAIAASAVTSFREGLRAVAAVLPRTFRPFGADDKPF